MLRFLSPDTAQGLKISKLHCGASLSHDVARCGQGLGGLLFTLSRYHLDKTLGTERNIWRYHLGSGFSCCFCFSSHCSLQLDWQPGIFAA